MELCQSPEQRELQEAARAVCRGLLPVGNRDSAATTRARASVGELGLPFLRVPDADGGLGRDLTDAAYIFEELGAALLPMELLTTHLTYSWLPEAREGGWHVGAAHPLDGLDGQWALESPEGLTHIAIHDDQLRVIPVRSLTLQPVKSLDPGVNLHTTTVADLTDTAAAVSGEDYLRYRLEEATLRAAYQVGIAQQVLDRSVHYALERHQFGRPVGSFQAVKHLLADMLVRTEVARSAVLASAAAMDDDDIAAARRLACGAARLADRAATANGRKSVQVHGGMGFAWEVDIHLYLKRAWVISATNSLSPIRTQEN